MIHETNTDLKGSFLYFRIAEQHRNKKKLKDHNHTKHDHELGFQTIKKQSKGPFLENISRFVEARFGTRLGFFLSSSEIRFQRNTNRADRIQRPRRGQEAEIRRILAMQKKQKN